MPDIFTYTRTKRDEEADEASKTKAAPPASPVDPKTGINFYKGMSEDELKKKSAAEIAALRKFGRIK